RRMWQVLVWEVAVPGGNSGGWSATTPTSSWGVQLPNRACRNPYSERNTGGGVVGPSAGVAKQLFDGDLVAVGQDPRQPPRHRVLQRQPPLGDQLQDHGDHQRLRAA